MKMSRDEFRTYPINERRWMIKRFLKQKEQEEKAYETAKKNAKKGNK